MALLGAVFGVAGLKLLQAGAIALSVAAAHGFLIAHLGLWCAVGALLAQMLLLAELEGALTDGLELWVDQLYPLIDVFVSLRLCNGEDFPVLGIR